MKRCFRVLYTTLLVFLLLTSIPLASVEWQIEKKLDIESIPLDVATTPDGKRTFVLTKGGVILIYSSGGILKDEITVDKSTDGIDVSRGGNKLFLSSRKNKSVEIITLDFIHDINIKGSPSRGPADAPVVVAVFSDFQ